MARAHSTDDRESEGFSAYSKGVQFYFPGNKLKRHHYISLFREWEKLGGGGGNSSMESEEGVAQSGQSGATPIMEGMTFSSGVTSAACYSKINIELWGWTALCLNPGSIIY